MEESESTLYQAYIKGKFVIIINDFSCPISQFTLPNLGLILFCLNFSFFFSFPLVLMEIRLNKHITFLMQGAHLNGNLDRLPCDISNGRPLKMYYQVNHGTIWIRLSRFGSIINTNLIFEIYPNVFDLGLISLTDLNFLCTKSPSLLYF